MVGFFLCLKIIFYSIYSHRMRDLYQHTRTRKKVHINLLLLLHVQRFLEESFTNVSTILNKRKHDNILISFMFIFWRKKKEFHKILIKSFILIGIFLSSTHKKTSKMHFKIKNVINIKSNDWSKIAPRFYFYIIILIVIIYSDNTNNHAHFEYLCLDRSLYIL